MRLPNALSSDLLRPTIAINKDDAKENADGDKHDTASVTSIVFPNGLLTPLLIVESSRKVKGVFKN